MLKNIMSNKKNDIKYSIQSIDETYSVQNIQELLKKYANKDSKRKTMFYKTDIGQYAEKDLFIGVTTPILRKIAQQFRSMSFNNIEFFLYSSFNEERLLALLILILQYRKSSVCHSKTIYEFSTKHLQQINNWNLVDTFAPSIFGHHLFHHKMQNEAQDVLVNLANHSSLWQRRISIVTTLYFIRQNHLSCTMHIAKVLLNDKEDLIYKAVGWMLREVDKKDHSQLTKFLYSHYNSMPRTMLRYAIEKFPDDERKFFLKK